MMNGNDPNLCSVLCSEEFVNFLDPASPTNVTWASDQIVSEEAVYNVETLVNYGLFSFVHLFAQEGLINWDEEAPRIEENPEGLVSQRHPMIISFLIFTGQSPHRGHQRNNFDRQF